MTRQRYIGSVSPKGQITLPVRIRQELGIEPQDRVEIELTGTTISVRRIGRLEDYFQSIPALNPLRSWEEIEAIAREDHALKIAAEG